VHFTHDIQHFYLVSYNRRRLATENELFTQQR